MKKIIVAAFLLSFALIACPNGPPPIIDTNGDCKTAETHLKQLGCIPKNIPYTVKGKSFEQFCTETMLNGINLNPGCLSNITACNQMNSCVQRR